MRNEEEIIPSLDDIVFESRNKEYGAYQLRRKYVPTVAIGLVLSMIIGSLAVLIPYLKYSSPSDIALAGGGGSRSVTLTLNELPPPVEQIYIRDIPPPPPERPAEIQEAVKYTPPVVVDSLPPEYTEIATMNDIIASADDTLMELNDEIYYSDGYDFGLGFGEGGGGSGAPFLLVEVMPSFRGGDLNTFRQWVQQRTNYPQEAIDKKIQGRVMLTFIIETDGSVSNVTVVKGVDPSIDNESVRVISSSPKWSPGFQGGKSVRVRYSMWLGFVL